MKEPTADIIYLRPMDKEQPKHYIDIEKTPEIEYDGVKFDTANLRAMSIELAHSNPAYEQMLMNASHRIMNDAYRQGLTIGEKDIIKTGPRIDKCRIICPGPSAEDFNFYHAEPMFSILCNKAIEFSALEWVWLVTDKNAEKCAWFSVGTALRNGAECCFPHDSLGEYNPEYTMHIAPCFPPINDQRFIRGIIMNGATIAGMALQIAFYLGAKTIELCGCDFEGDTYYDGTRAVGHQTWHEFKTRMNNYIKVVKHHGVDVYSRTETALDIEVRK